MATNRLAKETSPYLLQHAHNPVDWYAWGPEAFERARREDRPIFLSVGYSTCYWCHVMERQCFENEAIAAVMNELFVCIKLDREERPDVDQLYMTAVQVQTRHGGWPMSVFLTPGLEYFYGGTYFPPEDAHGRPGFVTLMRAIADAWTNRRDDVMRSAGQFTRILQQASITPRPSEPIRITAAEVANLVLESAEDYDPSHGGFGRAPKFPRQTLLELLLTATDPRSATGAFLQSEAPKIEQQLRHTLDAMMYGGIRDQLGGGFHRYSTDAQWLVPHFEIMLYDNAMLGWVYTEAARRFGEQRYAVVARELFDFVLREMTSPQGAFYTAIDAEVDAQEGLSYLWTPAEVHRALTDKPRDGTGTPFSDDDARLFAKVFGLDRGFNFADPHHGSGTADRNILFVAEEEVYHRQFELLRGMRRLLLEHRSRRKQPMLDTKVITQWNALMIRALAHAGESLNEPRYLGAAIAAAEYLLRHHRTDAGVLLRSSRDRVGKHAGFIDDYACLADALLSLHKATSDRRWGDAAAELVQQMRRRFEDLSQGGFFYTDESADDLIVRQKTAGDSPLPSGNAIAARVLIALGETTAAGRTLEAFAEQSVQHPGSMSSMLAAILHYMSVAPELLVVPSRRAEDPSPAGGATASSVVQAVARRTGPRRVELQLTIAGGWHINANPASKGLVATEVRVSGDPAAVVTYPPGDELQIAAGQTPVPAYRGKVMISIETSANSGTIRLTFEPCDDTRCLAAEQIQVPVPA